MKEINFILRLRKWQIMLLWIIYAVLFQRLFVATSYGWWGFANHIYYGGFYIFFTLIIALILFSRKQSLINIDIGLLLFISLIKCIILLFNYGDCSDAGGAITYIETFFIEMSELCSAQPDWKIAIPVFGFLINTIMIAWFSYSLYKSNE
ncbi:MAG: hypothetical protein QF815_01480 [Candidatus Peribacteraceae bacterium]|jgi:hypothetical protein|nr:hypothetical protein [Candidatus Peribacteraceae bacterium]MDP7477124.1 hypothetical protein [Candidatus Peribacteraceae bacterium]